MSNVRVDSFHQRKYWKQLSPSMISCLPETFDVNTTYSNANECLYGWYLQSSGTNVNVLFHVLDLNFKSKQSETMRGNAKNDVNTWQYFLSDRPTGIGVLYFVTLTFIFRGQICSAKRSLSNDTSTGCPRQNFLSSHRPPPPWSRSCFVTLAIFFKINIYLWRASSIVLRRVLNSSNRHHRRQNKPESFYNVKCYCVGLSLLLPLRTRSSYQFMCECYLNYTCTHVEQSKYYITKSDPNCQIPLTSIYWFRSMYKNVSLI